MKIYIPNHLRRIEVINQLYLMVDEYNKNYTAEKPEDNISDPVKNFINLCLGEEDKNKINYLIKLFYSVKGTREVFNCMMKYLNLNITDYVYTVKHIDLVFGSLSVTDEEDFYVSLVKFLDALLIFEELRTNIGVITLDIHDNVVKFLSSDLILYKKYNATDGTNN